MTWPPLKAWTYKSNTDEKIYFVAINYGGELISRWIIFMSVIDSRVVVKVSWSQIVESSDWVSGWDELCLNNVESHKLSNKKFYLKTTEFSYPSIDSGLTIPICKTSIRQWFD